MDEHELGGLTNLEELWIGKNKIEQIQGLEKVSPIQIVDIVSLRESILGTVLTPCLIYIKRHSVDQITQIRRSIESANKGGEFDDATRDAGGVVFGTQWN